MFSIDFGLFHLARKPWKLCGMARWHLGLLLALSATAFVSPTAPRRALRVSRHAEPQGRRDLLRKALEPWAIGHRAETS